MSGITINGKFLGAPLNGVHRTAAFYASALLSHRAEGKDIELVAPQPSSDARRCERLSPRVLQGWFGRGQGWEMATLPVAARGRLLVNLCNLGPVTHGNSVVMIHDAQTFLYPQDYTGRQAVAYRMLLPLIGRRARRVLTVSEFSKRSLAEFGIASEEKIDVVHNGTDHLMRIEPDASALGRHGLEAQNYALCLGATKSYKNIARLFAAFDHPDLADLPLVVAGGPLAASYAKLTPSIPANVRFLGRVTDGELRALYQNASMFLFPSRTEGFGLPPIEAMSCGCPVIAANAGAMPEVCGDGAALVDPEDTDAWRAAILRYRDPDIARERAEASAARAAHFTWERAGARLWDVVAELAA